ncbi:MAG: protein-disulfide reductase DsbD domain-containing protein [Pseudomonadota bacterium]
MRNALLIPFLAALALPAPGLAQSVDDLVQVQVLPGWREANGVHIAGVEISLAPGWITYWRAPGDGGIPPQFSFANDDAVSAITPHWPTPEVFYSNGMHSIGYDGGVVFPLTVAAQDAGPLSLSGELFIGICEEICIPVTVGFDATLPAAGAFDERIGDALQMAAIPADAAQVGTVTCRVSPLADGIELTAIIPIPQTAPSEFVVVEAGDTSIWVSEAEVSRDGASLQAVVEMVHPSGAPFALDRSALRLTVIGGPRAVDIRGCNGG